MGVPRARVRAIQALLKGSVLKGTPAETVVHDEYEETYRANRVRKQSRRWLLQVLHSTRGLDTFLGEFLKRHGIGAGKSLGSHLHKLKSHSCATIGQIDAPYRARFQGSVVDPRNKYMHNAGVSPANDAEVQTLLSEMDSLLVIVTTL